MTEVCLLFLYFKGFILDNGYSVFTDNNEQCQTSIRQLFKKK